MKKVYTTLIGLILTLTGFSQSCLPEGIIFSTQAQIENFQVNYPNCTQIEGDVTISGDDIYTLEGLNSLSSVQGNVTIYSNPLLTSLNGINGLNTIGGNLSIGIYESGFNLGNPALVDLSGLNNLTIISGDLTIEGNTSLTSIAELGSVASIGDLIKISSNSVLNNLTGLNNIDSAYGVVIISGNDSLTDLNGLNGLIYAGQLDITGNSSLTSLAGLNNLISIGWNLFIEFNNELANLDDLESLNNIRHNIYIDGNASLTSLYGLDNVADTSMDYLVIINNPLLSTCDVQSICDYLASPNGTIEIHDNATGCNSQAEVEAACLNNCLPDGITFATQAQIDSFQINYPNCTEIEGDVEIGYNYGSGSNITNLNGLSVINSIGGSLFIYYNYELTDLNGMEGLTFIGGSLWIGYSQHLTNLSGLKNLTSVGGNLYITYNTLLNNLTGLENLTSIGGEIWIWQNPTITSLTGLDNINSESISNLSINWNISLSVCAVESICDYLASPNGTVEIHDNSTGCNSQEEVDSACVYLSNGETYSQPTFSINPNPASTAITISTPTTPLKNTLMTIYNINGQQLIERRITEQQTVVNVAGLSQGVYFVRVANDRTVQVGKFVKQ